MADLLAYLNGQFVDAAELSISPADAGFVYGATATDLVRTFAGRLFRLQDHLTRFRESCRLCRIPLSATDADLQSTAERLIAVNRRGDEDLGLVMFATPGPLGRYAGRAEDGPPTIAMHTMPIPLERNRRLFEEGARLVISRLTASPVDPRAKMRSRLHWWIAEQEVKAVDPHAMVLFADAEGFVTETAAANFLAVIDGVVTSPPRTGILNGVSLQVVEELCRERGIPFSERPLPVKDCWRADEAMLCGTMFCLTGVRRIDGTELTWPGPTFLLLAEEWRETCRINIAVPTKVPH